MKRLLLVFLFLFSLSSLNAKNNRIEIGMGGYRFSNTIGQFNSPFNSINIKYTRNINSELGLYANFMHTPLFDYIVFMENDLFDKDSMGKIGRRDTYKYLDIGGSYKILKYNNHTLNANIGASFAYGVNLYVAYLLLSPPTTQEPNGEIIYTEHPEIKEGYFGGIIGLSYDYTFWKDKLNIGINFGARKYLNKNYAHLEIKHPDLQHIDPNIPGGKQIFPFQINYGIHLGFNF